MWCPGNQVVRQEIQEEDTQCKMQVAMEKKTLSDAKRRKRRKIIFLFLVLMVCLSRDSRDSREKIPGNEKRDIKNARQEDNVKPMTGEAS